MGLLPTKAETIGSLTRLISRDYFNNRIIELGGDFNLEFQPLQRLALSRCVEVVGRLCVCVVIRLHNAFSNNHRLRGICRLLIDFFNL